MVGGSDALLDCVAMLAVLLAAALFPTHLTVPFQCVRVAIVRAGSSPPPKRSRAVIEGSRIVSTFAAGPHPSSIAVADLDGDGKLDLASRTTSRSRSPWPWRFVHAHVQIAFPK